MKVNDRMFEIDKQRKRPGIDKLCPSERNFPPHASPPKKDFAGGRIVFYHSEYQIA